MKHATKLVCLVLALIFVAALFAGCGGGQQQSTPAPAANTPAAATPQGTMTPEISKSEEHEVTEDTKYADEITFRQQSVADVFRSLATGQAKDS